MIDIRLSDRRSWSISLLILTSHELIETVSRFWITLSTIRFTRRHKVFDVPKTLRKPGSEWNPTRCSCSRTGLNLSRQSLPHYFSDVTSKEVVYDRYYKVVTPTFHSSYLSEKKVSNTRWPGAYFILSNPGLSVNSFYTGSSPRDHPNHISFLFLLNLNRIVTLFSGPKDRETRSRSFYLLRFKTLTILYQDTESIYRCECLFIVFTKEGYKVGSGWISVVFNVLSLLQQVDYFHQGP